MAHFVLFCMGTETQFVNAINHFTQIVTALYAVFQFAENLANLVFNGVGIFGRQFELFEIRKQFVVYKVGKVITCKRVMVNFSVPCNFGAAQ